MFVLGLQYHSADILEISSLAAYASSRIPRGVEVDLSHKFPLLGTSLESALMNQIIYRLGRQVRVGIDILKKRKVLGEWRRPLSLSHAEA